MEQTPHELAEVYQIPDVRYTAILFPGIVKNDPQKALSMLNGEKSVAGMVYGGTKSLPLKFRPKDKLSHATFGDIKSSSGLLLRIRRKRDRTNKTFEVKKIEAIGKVVNEIRFEGMCDFQQLQPSNPQGEALGKIKEEAPKIQDEFSNERINLPPLIFCRYDSPQEYYFRANPASTKITEETEEGTVIKRKLKRPTPQQVRASIINFNAEIVPTSAMDEVPEEVHQEEFVKKLKSMFEQRPIWSRMAIQHHLQSKSDAYLLKTRLPIVAYFFNNGPWRLLWIRHGLDPRSNSSFGPYQMLHFRVQQEYKDIIKEKRKQRGFSTASEDFGGANALRRQPKRRIGHINDLSSTIEENDLDENDAKHAFTFDSLPTQTQTFYQLCDINMQSVKDIVDCVKDEIEVQIQDKSGRLHSRVISVKSDTCTEKSGWYTKEALEQVRLYMKNQVDSWLQDIDSYQEVNEDETEETQLGGDHH
ncbi:general transcription factor GTF3C5 [Acrasis kona]|uniref:General transcription factor GTF3C5 n=1 Tax=Acrasis kona TaxID=1008807 RepID=A0AAW2YHY7_9EUKA